MSAKADTIKDKQRLRGAAGSLSALVVGGAASLISSDTALAQIKTDEGTVSLQHYYWEDWQPGQSRMQVHNPTALVNIPIQEGWSAWAILTSDTISGASALYHDTLSGASGLGIQDSRRAINLRSTRDYERASITLGVDLSDENEYFSQGGSVQFSLWDEDQNTTVTLGMSGNDDTIDLPNNDTFLEKRQALSYLAGVTHNLNSVSRVQVNLSYQDLSGYLSEHTKKGDHRPSDRDLYLMLVRYRLYLESIDASLHLDYRTNLDSWDIHSHMVEAHLYKELTEKWLLRPLVRYYTQGAASFYNREFPPAGDGFYSADYRMGAFGTVSTGLKVEYKVSDVLSLLTSYEIAFQESVLRAGGNGGGLAPLTGQLLGVGLTVLF